MKLISVNVGEPRIVETPRGEILTSIFKQQVEGRRKVVPHNVEGDRQADLSVHGGPSKAVYGYAHDHYDYWTRELPGEKLSFGMFGENLTIDGLFESDIHIGDLVAIGTTRLRVTQPRMPCVKLAIRFNRPDMVKRFWKSGRSGIYFAVEQAGDIGAGDSVTVLVAHPLKVSVTDVIALYRGDSHDKGLYERSMAAPLSGGWKNEIRERWMSS